MRGRLLTVNGVSLVPGSKGLAHIEAKIAATAYLAPSATESAADAVHVRKRLGHEHRSGPLELRDRRWEQLMITHVRNLAQDLVERRLWPVALLLAVALAAVPVVLGRGGDDAASTAALPATPATGDAGTARRPR